MRRYGDIRKLTWRGRTSARWYVRVHDDSRSTWKCTGFSDRDCAEAIVRRWQIEAITGASAPSPGMDRTVADALELWRAQATFGRSKRYAQCIVSASRRWGEAFGGLPMREFIEAVITRYITQRAGEGKAPRTINLDLRLLRLFTAWCREEGMLRGNIVSRRLHMPEPIAVPRVLSDGDDARLLAAAAKISERVYGYVLCLLTTGFRSHLASHVEWPHVDMGARMWRIPAVLLKSKREYRQPIAARLCDWLSAHWHETGKIFGTYARRVWPKLRAEAGLAGLKQHDLRRTFITRARQAGVKLEVAMELSDHRDVRTMMRFYRRIDVSEAREAIERIDAQRKETVCGTQLRVE